MLDFVTINAIADRVARQQVTKGGLERVVTQPITDSEGNEALRITFVLQPQAIETLNGDAALDLLVDLQNALQEEGEERLPIVEYATEQELEPEEDEDMGEDEA